MSDAKARLRQYLEQRRDLGESEFMLDNMSVEEAMRTLGALRSGPVARAPRRAAEQAAPSAPPPERAMPTLSREAPPAAERPSPPAAAVTPTPMPTPPPTSKRFAFDPPPEEASTPGAASISPSEVGDMKKLTPGLVVGAASGALFEANPFASVKSLDGIAELVAKCTRCPLYKTATNPVPGEGNPSADVMVVGEAPGANEDATGRPFIGAAGQLLTKILAAIDLQREDIFIANVLKHRPPGNRNPAPNEIEACSPYLLRQIELIQPKVILALGTFAAQTLLDTKTPMGKLRGMVHRYHGVPLIVTYHPAALLRNPNWKRPTWEDVKLARRILDHGITG